MKILFNKFKNYFVKTKIDENTTQYVLSLFGIILWVSTHSKKCGWFRIFGKGLKWKHINNGLIFSERNGYRKYLRINKYFLSLLR